MTDHFAAFRKKEKFGQTGQTDTGNTHIAAIYGATDVVRPSDNKGLTGQTVAGAIRPCQTSIGPEVRQNESAENIDLEAVVSPVMLVRPDLDDFEERSALIETGANVPRALADGFATLCVMPKPDGVTERRWQAIVNDAGHFVDAMAAKVHVPG